jgi:bis(5'-nucleosyl)-tetraphosphatase (symmetrical)
MPTCKPQSTTWSPRRSNLATYAIGDLQGCYEPLARLVDSLKFDPARDRLWFVGDLVNRGPDSLACLRFVKSLGEAAVSVLGNHDLHLLCVAEGVEKRRKRDTIDEVLEAPDRDDLLQWLRHRPLMHVEEGFALVHAGMLPQWSVPRARELAAEVESRLRAPDYRALLEKMYGDEPGRWDDGLAGIERVRVIINAMTRLRVCTPDGAMSLEFKGEIGDAQREGLTPWFEAPGRRSADHTVIFGHWSALGLTIRANLLGLDSGCVWGRALSSVRLGDRKLLQVQCVRPQGRED